MKTVQPMLAASKAPDLDALTYPVLVSPKYDGIRCITTPEGPLTRTLLPIPNVKLHAELSKLPPWLDGELIYGLATGEDTFNVTQSEVMAENGTCLEMRYFVFDICGPDTQHCTFSERLDILDSVELNYVGPVKIMRVMHRLCASPATVSFAYDSYRDSGFEGAIIRSPHGTYKYGRSTLAEQLSLKLKAWDDSEAVIIGLEEGKINNNVQTRDARGYAKRTSHKAGKTPSGTLGRLVLRDLKTGKDFRCGSGLNDLLRDQIWNNKALYIGETVTYKHQGLTPHGKPRLPIFKGFRNRADF